MVGTDRVDGGFLPGEGGEATETVRLHDDVGIEKEEPVAARGIGALLTRPGLAIPALGEVTARDDPGPVLGGDGTGAIGRMVIHDDDLVRSATL